MKIKKLSCMQFAGIRDRDVSFNEGLNVVFGKNESGKSTLVNLLSRTLFQKARLDRRSNKDFYESFFPGEKRNGGAAGDYADGSVAFETEKGVYVLKKEWGSEARCTLSTPDGSFRDQERIDEILKEALRYGEGVYADMLFSPQSHAASSLKDLLDAGKSTETKQEITDAVSRAFAAGDGLSPDAIEAKILEKIKGIEGEHWDDGQGIPERKRGGGRWSNGKGEILEAYYRWEDAKAELEEISLLEADADRATGDFSAKDAAFRAAEDALRKFSAVASRLVLQNAQKREMERLDAEIAKVSEVLAEWPRLLTDREKAKALLTEKKNREIREQYEKVGAILDEIAKLEQEIAGRPCPTEEEIRQSRTAQRDIAALKNKLCGMNITAAIQMLGENTVEITSLRTGEAIDGTDGAVCLTEAVKIAVPGVMEMQLAPADVDVAAVEGEIAAKKRLLDDLFARYEVKSTEDLEALAKEIADGKTKLAAAGTRRDYALGTTRWEELEAAAKDLPAVLRPSGEIQADIMALCGALELSTFLTRTETRVEGYENDHQSLSDLKDKADNLKKAKEKAEANALGADDLPAEYQNVADPDAYRETLEKEAERCRDLREAALTAKTAAETALEAKRSSCGDLTERVKEEERLFMEQKSLLAHWKHIAAAFAAQKNALHNNPMQDIAESFANYLGVISGRSVSSEFPKADKLDLKVYSKDRVLDYGKLSEGTKETVSLAFRLAVLDHLFPEGGIIVFDDPFTDMDAERTAASCELLKKCAERHQVIFLTCKEEYLSMLGGNVIRL